MSAIGPGDLVEAIVNEPGGWGFVELIAGCIYEVVAVSPPTGEPIACQVCGEAGEGLLTRHDRPHGPAVGMGWCPCAFKPVDRPSASFIEDLKAPLDEAPNRVREAA